MLKYICLFLLITQIAICQSVEGYWKTVDEDGISKSIVKIYKSDDGTVEGKVYKILKESERDRLCTACKGEMKNKQIEGLLILKDMKKDGDQYKGGEITNPENGKVYDCKIWVDEDNPDMLHVRGYISFFYRTQHWKRAEEGEF
jgi:uncharacterized protein (DUF2147 family)